MLKLGWVELNALACLRCMQTVRNRETQPWRYTFRAYMRTRIKVKQDTALSSSRSSWWWHERLLLLWLRLQRNILMQRIHTQCSQPTRQWTKSLSQSRDDASARIETANPTNTLFLYLSVSVSRLARFVYICFSRRTTGAQCRHHGWLAVSCIFLLVIQLCHRSRFVLRGVFLTSHS